MNFCRWERNDICDYKIKEKEVYGNVKISYIQILFFNTCK